MTSPVIGITTRRMDAGARRLDVVDQAYGTAIWQAGGTAHLLPRPPGAGSDRALAGLDGLLLTGGGDVDPDRYGHAPSPEIGGVDPDRDDWEIAFIAITPRNLMEDTHSVSDETMAVYRRAVGVEAPAGV